MLRMFKVCNRSNIFFFFYKKNIPHSCNLCSDSKEDTAALDECSYPGRGFNLKVEKCSAKVCNTVSHHLFQNDYGERMFLEEKGYDFCCNDQLNGCYNPKGGKGILESMDARFQPVANASKQRSITRTSELKNILSSYPTAQDAQLLMRDAAKDPKQMTIPNTVHISNTVEKDLKKKWLKSMDKVIQEISVRFRRLELCG